MGSQVTTLRLGADRRGTVSGPEPDGVLLVGEQVEFPDVVAVELRRLSAGTKKSLWRARQLQNRAYNWGVEHALGLHNAGGRIPSPRVDAAALTRLRRHPENRKGGLRLQRGGWCQGVWAVTKWSQHRRSLIGGLSRSGEKVGATAERLTQAGDSLPADLRKCLVGLVDIASEYTSAVSGLVTGSRGPSGPVIPPRRRHGARGAARAGGAYLPQVPHPLRTADGRTQEPAVPNPQTNRRPCPTRRRCFSCRCGRFERRRHRTR